MEKVRYGVVGYGDCGQVHCRILSSLPSASLEVICDLDERKLDLARKLYPKSRFYHEIDEIFANEEIEAISICTPHNTHFDLSKKAFSRKVHVLCEKPLAITIEDSEEMIRKARENGVYLGYISQHRFEFAPSLLKREIERGILGDIISTSISVKWKKERDYYEGSWKGNKSKAGGGVIINQGIHMIDVASWLNGGISSVYAMSRTSRDYIDVEDNAVVLVEYENGAFGVFDFSTSTNPFLGTGLEVVGSKNTVKLFEGRILKWGGKTPEEIQNLNDRIAKIDEKSWGKKYFGYGHIYQIKEFVESILNKREPIVNGEEGKKVLEIVVAIMNSSVEGRRIKIN